MSSKLDAKSAADAVSQALEITVVKGIVLKELENRTKLSREVLMDYLDRYDWRLLRPPPEASESRGAFEVFIERTVRAIERSIRP